MEALLFILDSFTLVALVYMGLRDDRRSPGAPQTSLFRMVEMEDDVRPAQNGTPWRKRVEGRRPR